MSVLRTQILRAAEACECAVIAYCFMPDHAHLLVEGLTESASLPVFVNRAKQLSGYHGKRIVGGPVWQTGYFERVLRDDESSREVVAYILANPVRAGLVAEPGDHPFSGSGTCTLAELIDLVQV